MTIRETATLVAALQLWKHTIPHDARHVDNFTEFHDAGALDDKEIDNLVDKIKNSVSSHHEWCL